MRDWSSPGVFALGYTREARFVIAYLGRADSDLQTGLMTHLGGPYQQFKFTYALSAVDAFGKQCELYHQCLGLENSTHPNPPDDDDMELVCPHCRISRRLQRVGAR
jgi:hypothetical protein